MAQPALKTATNIETLTGAERAAVLVMYLDRPVAKRVLSFFSAPELHELGMAMAGVDQVDATVVEEVVAEFIRDLHSAAMVPKSGPDFVLNVLPELIEDERRPRIISPLRRAISTTFRDLVGASSARTLMAVLQDEHPQTQAVALLLMGSDHAAKVLPLLGEQERKDLTLRMARIEQVPGELADDVEAAIVGAIEQRGMDRWEVSGVDSAAKILGTLDVDDQEDVLDSIAETEPSLSETLRKRMVVFTDLIILDDRAIQAILKEIERDQLVIALRGAAPDITDLFLRNMSSRAAGDTREEIELVGRLPRATIDGARETIVETVLRLRDDGAITLPLGGMDMV
jgi:flagellar motor switch protein FliG